MRLVSCGLRGRRRNYLPPGLHKVLVSANHPPLEKGVVTFVVPDVKIPNYHR